MTRTCIFLAALCALITPYTHVFAQEFSDSTLRARVVEVHSYGERSIPETRLSVPFQELTLEIIEGPRAGETLEAENTTSVSFAVGDIAYVHRITTPLGEELWSLGEPDRRGVLLGLAVLFVVTVVLVAGMPGARSLLSLVVSFLILIFGLVPLLSSGAPPVLTSVIFATGMLVLSMLITHGAGKPTLIALFGSIVALVLGALVTELAVAAAKLSGFVSDETTYLHFSSGGALDLSALLLGGILIGIVGVLNDISVSQVHTVSELIGANGTLSRTEVLKKAMRVGQEHLGAVVNTLPLAYAGAALPLLMLFAASDAPFLFIINREMFSAEIIRILAGGIALALSGFVATWTAVYLLVPRKNSRATISSHQ